MDQLERSYFGSYNHLFVLPMSFQFGYDVWKLADSKWDCGRQIPSFSELITNCKLPVELYLKEVTSGKQRSKDHRLRLSPVVAYESPPLTDPNPGGHSSESSVPASPLAHLVSTSELLQVDSQENVQESPRTDPINVVTPQSLSPGSESDKGYHGNSASSQRRKREARIDKKLRKKRKRSLKGALMSHEKVLFSCSPRPATKHSSEGVIYPQNLLNKDLCLKKNTQCSQCGSRKTPEWRSGPTGSRTLCNACGLFFAKLTKKLGHEEASEYFVNLKKSGDVFDRRIGSLNQ